MLPVLVLQQFCRLLFPTEAYIHAFVCHHFPIKSMRKDIKGASTIWPISYWSLWRAW
jgi:hypothetical protein